MKKLFLAVPVLMATLTGCQFLQDASLYTQNVIKGLPESVVNALRMIMNILLGLFNGFVTDFFGKLIPPQ